MRGGKIADACIVVNYRRAYDHGVRFVQTRSNAIVTNTHVPYNCLDGWIDVDTNAFAPWAWPSIDEEGDQTYIDLTQDDATSSTAGGDTMQTGGKSGGNVILSGTTYKKIFDKALNAGSVEEEETRLLGLDRKSKLNIEQQKNSQWRLGNADE